MQRASRPIPPSSARAQAGVITDIVLLATVGIRVILVHGGGPEINSWLEKVGIQALFKNGLRVTDGKCARHGLCMHKQRLQLVPL
jgi:acetylglutamate kinase